MHPEFKKWLSKQKYWGIDLDEFIIIRGEQYERYGYFVLSQNLKRKTYMHGEYRP